MANLTMNLTSANDWDVSECRPSSGSGTLARLGRVVLLVGSTDPDVVAPLLGQAEMVAANGGEGRQLVRGFALLLGTSASEPPDFVALAPHATGLAVLVQGDASVTINGQSYSGRDSLAWVEKLVPWPITQLEAIVDSASTPRAHLRLGDGVIEAGGLSLGTVTSTEGEPVMEPVMEASPPPTPPTADLPVVQADTGPIMATPTPTPPAPPSAPDRPTPPQLEDNIGHFDSVLLHDVDDFDEVPTPLPLVVSERDVTDEAAHEHVRGVFCKNRHFNDPRQLFCAVCGINMVQQTPVLVNGSRPPLGVIVLDDGAVFQVDSDYLLGRDPGSDERVRSGDVRGVPVQDTSNQISRVHARLELRGWDVVLIDNASTNGTFVNAPKAAGWERLPSGGEHVLVQGTRVRIGHRTLAFNTHAGQ